MKIEFQFIPEGKVAAEIEDHHIYVDVGSVSHPQVFDHHAGHAAHQECPASMIWDARENLRQRFADAEQILVCTHEQPDWNACWAVCLLKLILEGKTPDEKKVKALNTYSGFVLNGFNPSDGPVERSVLSLYESLMAEIEETEKAPEIRDSRKILISCDFFQFCHDAMTDYNDLKTGGFLSEDSVYGRYMLIIREDYHEYLRDLRNSRKFIARVRRKNDAAVYVDGLKMKAPVSRLFKFWSRSDREHSAFGSGFPLLWVQWEPQVWIVSVNPSSGYLLSGLGDHLTREECRLSPPDPSQPHRPGYDCPNPWYDARNTPNANTIVASPYGGTQLKPEQVEKELRRFFNVRKWKPAVEKPSWVRSRLIPYGVPLLSLLILAAVAWWLVFYFSEPDGCAKWNDLPKADIMKSRYAAVCIGINDYSRVTDYGNLYTPVVDAEQMLEILVQEYGFEPESTEGSGSILLKTGGVEPTLDNIRRSIITLAKQKLTPADSLLVYYAGHGEGKKDDLFGKWIPADGEDAVFIDHFWIHEVLKKTNVRHVLIIADCCYAGGKMVETGKTRAKPIYHIPLKPSDNVEALFQLPSRQGLFSGYYEEVPDGEGHSPFAKCLMAALRENRKPFITVSELYKELFQCTQKSESAKKPFLSVIDGTCDRQGEFIFRRKP